MTTSATPVVFIHGLWLHATSWQPWVELFGEAGYDPIAPGWPGEPDTVAEAREHPDAVADHRHRRRHRPLRRRSSTAPAASRSSSATRSAA